MPIQGMLAGVAEFLCEGPPSALERLPYADGSIQQPSELAERHGRTTVGWRWRSGLPGHRPSGI